TSHDNPWDSVASTRCAGGLPTPGGSDGGSDDDSDGIDGTAARDMERTPFSPTSSGTAGAGIDAQPRLGARIKQMLAIPIPLEPHPRARPDFGAAGDQDPDGLLPHPHVHQRIPAQG